LEVLGGRPLSEHQLKPVLATAGADYARHWRGTSRAFVLPQPL